MIAVAINYLPPRLYSRVFKISMTIMMVDFFLCVIWLPIGVSRTYGFRSAKDVFTMRCEFPPGTVSLVLITGLDNGTGAPAGWNWILSLYVIVHDRVVAFNSFLCSLFTAGTMTGFDASGHIAEETKNAR